MYLAQQTFFPGFIGIFTNISYIDRKYIYKAVKKHADRMTGKLLDYGCGSKPYQSLFKNVSQYIGVDLLYNEGHSHENENIDVFYDGKRLPFDENEFNAVFTSQVLEHVPNINNSLSEINRVLKPGGLLLLVMPFVFPEHEIPNDFRRLTIYGIKQVLKECDFEIIEAEKLGTFPETLAQLIVLFIGSKTHIRRRGWRWVNTIVQTIFLSPFFIAGMIGGFIFRKHNRLYLDICVLAKKGV